MSSRRQSNILLGVVLFCLAGIPLLLFLFVLGTYSGHTQAALRFLGGFYFFLRENLPRISTNAATWVPGLMAFFLGVVAIHFLFAKQVRRKGLSWGLGTSFALAAIVPVLFVVAFLAPGVILQIRDLPAGSGWFHRGDSITETTVTENMKQIGMMLLEDASENGGRFPDSLNELLSNADKGLIKREWSSLSSPEPLIYLGAGLSDTSDPSVPLLISRPLVRRDGSLERKMLTIGYEIRMIPAEAADEWITRALDARR